MSKSVFLNLTTGNFGFGDLGSVFLKASEHKQISANNLEITTIKSVTVYFIRSDINPSTLCLVYFIT